jgi:hypothetical protein
MNAKCRALLSAFVCVLATGCAVQPTVRERLAPGSKIAIVMFRDCTIPGQEDCGGSGISAASVFARVLSDGPEMTAVPLSRPVIATMPLSDDAAEAYAKQKGFRYVVNGDVEDYYRVAPLTFRPERAGVSVRLLDTSTGQVMAFLSDRGTANNLSSPDAILARLAKRFRAAISQ